MIIHCCRNRSSDYQQVKQRYNPTFVHHDIFSTQTPRERQPRFSRTFYSTALDTQGYNIKTIQEKKHKKGIQQPLGEDTNVISPDYSHQRRLEDLYPRTRIGYESKQKWFDHAKEDYLSRVRNCHATETLRQRKVMQLSSGPVFVDFDYQNRAKNAPLHVDIGAKKNPQTQTVLVKQYPTAVQVQLIVENRQNKQAKITQVINIDSANEPNNLGNQIKKRDSHKKKVIENYGLQQTINRKKGNLRRSQSSPKPVSNNPMFSLVRGNKIDNRLHRK